MLGIGIIFLLVGFVNLYRPVLEWLIRFGNMVRGTKTEITQGTIIYSRITGVIFTSLGIVFIVLGFLEIIRTLE